MKILCIDIGNTSIKKGTSLNNKIIKIDHLNYSKDQLSKIYTFLKKDLDDLDMIYICSVVPEIDKFISKKFEKHSDKISFIKKIKLKKFIDPSVNMKQLGTDRLINVLAASKLFKKINNFIIIDSGTATTIDLVINKKYFGGIILPGVKTSYTNLIDLASGIKEIKFQQSKKIIGKDTKGALLAGYNTGYKLLIEAYIQLLQNKYHNKFKVIFTGGYASNTLNKQSKFTYKEDITLLGISYYSSLYL